MIGLAAIDAAIFAQLTALQKQNGGQFNYVGHWCGEVTPDSYEGEIVARTPACLLALEREKADNDFESLRGFVETRGETRWTVLIVVRDTRGATTTQLGAQNGATGTGSAGAYALADQVLPALNNLKILGTGGSASNNLLLREKGIEYEETVPYLARPGEIYVLAIRFKAQRSIDEAAFTDTSATLTVIDAKINEPTGGTYTPPNPLSEAEFNPNTAYPPPDPNNNPPG